MWLITKSGFFSAVQATDEPEKVVVRTRVKADADHLSEWLREIGFPSEIIVYEFSDYPWRVVTSRNAWGMYVAMAAHDIDYPNFKAAVKAVQGPDRADVYGLVWEDLLRLEGLDPEQRTSPWRWAT